MAGGPNAAVVICIHCAGKANRVHEGFENDTYECEACGKGFAIDWSRLQPEKPLWPPTPEELEEARRLIELLRKSRSPGSGSSEA